MTEFLNGRHPEAEVRIDAELLRVLLEEQCPDLAREDLVPAGEGWDNVMYRIGSSFAARLPRRSAAVGLLLNEQQWLPTLVDRLGVAVPAPVRLGVPSKTYPWPWSVVPWIPGDTADRCPLQSDQVERLAGVLGRLHRPAPSDAPPNLLRGGALRTRARFAATRLAEIEHLTEEARAGLLSVLHEGVVAPVARERVWLHGDLHPRNVLSAGGELSGIIDWGDITAGDRATDLAAAWMLFRRLADRRRFWAFYGADGATIRRAGGWAVFFGAVLAGSGEPEHEAIGRRLLESLLTSPTGC